MGKVIIGKKQPNTFTEPVIAAVTIAEPMLLPELKPDPIIIYRDVPVEVIKEIIVKETETVMDNALLNSEIKRLESYIKNHSVELNHRSVHLRNIEAQIMRTEDKIRDLNFDVPLFDDSLLINRISELEQKVITNKRLINVLIFCVLIVGALQWL